MSLGSASHASPRADGLTHGSRFQLRTKDDLEISGPQSGRGKKNIFHVPTKVQLHCQESHRSVASTTEDLPSITTTTGAGARSQTSDPEKNEAAKGASEDEPLYVEFTENDARDPFSWSFGKKWLTLLVACSYTSFVSSTASAYAVGYPSMNRDLHSSGLAASAGLSTYTFGFALASLVLSGVSEEFGRRVVYLATCFGFFILFLPIALAKSITTVIVCRLFQGCVASTGATMVGGTIADLFRTHERGLPMSVYTASAFIGVGLGPVAASWIEGDSHLEWRWIQWISMMCASVQFISIYLFIPETRGAILLVREAKKLREQTGDLRYRARIEDEHTSLKTLIFVSCTRAIWLLISEPIVFSFSIWIGFVWGVLYVLIQSVGLVFKTLYPGMTPGDLGSMFLALVIGSVLGFLTSLWQEAIYRRKVATRGPEARLYGACGGVFCITAGSFIYAWTALPSKNIPFIAPDIGITLIAIGMFHIYLAAFNYMADAYLIYASSALSGQSFIRNIVGASFALFARQMYENLQFKWASTLLGCISVVLSSIPFVLMAWGPTIRAHSRVAKELALVHKDK